MPGNRTSDFAVESDEEASVNESEISSALLLLRNALRLGDMSEGTDRLPHLYC